MLVMAMAKSRIRALPMGMAAVTRSLCTAAAGAEGGKYKPLYRRLLALGLDPKGRVAETMEGWLEAEMKRNVRELRKHKSYKTALELTDWMESKGQEISFSTHALRLDLILKVRGIDMAERYFSSLPEPAVVSNMC